ncbi:3-keto-5-aminohexanoate cleavage protein [Saccharibacillus sp. CPCC 101409]|uniref:3-keto-5-aminohexanoate cleavage protein n=1 Tax=Saccharibacillus sp. CPCC 101409 TaxID=3058041 RepID=UPI0026734ADF|nr:3-keto-5-aminohexanoate cleavage protein [Saccharibacillus sp. CPCC 101409]MDO3410845.1 3-keto-5-aminohexanoate cleavage protein [Saccharibacillus sp. CPCC 101409]
MLQACLNGSRSRDYHAAVPHTPEEVAAEAEKAVLAGADELHIHVYAEHGEESMEPADVDRLLRVVREKVPGIPVGLSTAWRILPDPVARLECIRAWNVLPDYVSVNVNEEDAEPVIAALLKRGIGVEAGLSSPEDAEIFASMPQRDRCLRVLIEMQSPEDDRGTVRRIRQILRETECYLPQLLHGFDSTVWPMYTEAVLLGLDRRVGFEDGCKLMSGLTALDNADMVRIAKLLQGGN